MLHGHERCVRLLATMFLFPAAFAACSSGGGAAGADVGPPASQVSVGGTTPAPGASTTTASGTVVNDANGSPLAGVRVVLMPWSPCGATPAPTSITPESDGCPTPLPAPQATTNAAGQFTLANAPNGHYLLVIGADAVATLPPGYATPVPGSSAAPTPVPFTVQATIHDNVTLDGGAQTLVAPTIPPVPTVTPKTWETNGDYRLATLDATTEMPCYLAWQYERSANGLSLATIDEWLLEDVREVNAYLQTGGTQSQKLLTTGSTQVSGGAACYDMIHSYAFSGLNPYSTDPRTLWFAGQYVPYQGGSVSASGVVEFPIDPRSFVDPNIPVWL
jgi:hypothetical protein